MDKTNILSGIDNHMHRPVLRYMLSLLLCLVCYFPLTIITMDSARMFLERTFPGLRQSEVSGELFLIIWRTLLAWAGIVISAIVILRLGLVRLLRHLSAYAGQFALVFIIFLLLLLVRDLVLGALLSYKISFNAAAYAPSNVNLTLLLVFAGLLIIPLHALAEEVIYRALPIRGFFLAWKKLPLAIVISALLFWLNHGGQTVVYWMVIGVLLGLLAVRTNTIIYTWAIHAAFNYYNAEIMNSVSGTDFSSPALLLRHAASNNILMLTSNVVCVVLMVLLVFIWHRSRKPADGK